MDFTTSVIVSLMNILFVFSNNNATKFNFHHSFSGDVDHHHNVQHKKKFLINKFAIFAIQQCAGCAFCALQETPTINAGEPKRPPAVAWYGRKTKWAR